MATTSAAPPVPEVSASPDQGEHRVLIHGVDWKAYGAIRALVDSPGIRMAYADGVLEIMSPSRPHEGFKTRIGRLLELYALERDLPLYGYGSTTFRREPKETALEPDECYNLRPARADEDYPDLAIEVALTSGGLPRLKLYSRLGVREVWFWVNRGLRLYALGPEGYEEITRSRVLPDLDLESFVRFVLEEDEHEAVKGYRDALRTR